MGMEKKNNPIFKITCLMIFTTAISLLAHSAFAETKIFVKEYTYQASEEDSRNSSRTVSLREVKRLLLEELGTYLESITEVKSFHLTKDQIFTLTAGIVSAEIMEEKWDGKVYWLKARISADQDSVIKSIDTLRKDREKVKELEETRKRSEELLKENERLKKELAGKTGKKKKTAQSYQRNIKNLTAAEWFEKGYALGTSGNYTSAVEAFTNAIELHPQRAGAYNNRGNAYAELGNHQRAIKDYSKAIELDPKFAGTYYNRGLLYADLGNYQQAIKDYSRAIELNPKDAAAYHGRGNAYRMLGNYQQAIKDYSRAIELNPQYVAAYNNRGFLYADLGNYQQAIKDFSKPIELNPKDATAYYSRGFVYDVMLGNHQQAIQDFKIAARLGNTQAQEFLRKEGIVW